MFNAKVAGWKTKNLSLARRITFGFISPEQSANIPYADYVSTSLNYRAEYWLADMDWNWSILGSLLAMSTLLRLASIQVNDSVYDEEEEIMWGGSLDGAFTVKRVPSYSSTMNLNPEAE